MFTQPLAPIAGSLALSALLAALPLVLLFLLLGVFKVKAWLASLIALAVSIAVAIIVILSVLVILALKRVEIAR